ncbi:MAG TPA: hypothetical protein PK636_10135, partial [bacterium]|nr:hypothetical protein [bacterium]
ERERVEIYRRCEYLGGEIQELIGVLKLAIRNSNREAEGEADNVCYHPRARDALENVIAWGFEDCFRSNHPEERLYTFFDYRTPWLLKRRMGWRIDYIMAAPALARRCRGSWIDLEPRLGERPSDHTFLLAEFE